MSTDDTSHDVIWLDPSELAAWKGLQRMQAQLAGRLARDLSATSSLSLQDYTVLVVLSERPEGRMRAFELGLELGWEKSRLSHHLARMAVRGLVRRERCPTDQRGLNVVLTPLGRHELEAAAPDHVASVRRWFVDLLTPAQLAAIAGASEKVIGTLISECENHDSPGPGPP